MHNPVLDTDTPRPIYLGRKRQVAYKATDAIRLLGMSSRTFYKYVKLLGIVPYPRRGRRGRWYKWDDIMRIECAVWPPTRG